MCRAWFIRFYKSISRLFHLACFSHNFHFLDQRGSALESISAFWEQSMQNRAMDLKRIPLWMARLFSFLRRWVISSFLSIGTLNADSSGDPGFCLYQAFQDLPRFPKKPFLRIRRARKKKNEDPSQTKPGEAAAPTFTATAWGSRSLIRTQKKNNRVSRKENEKPGWKQKQKGEKKSIKRERSLVLVLTYFLI